MRDVLGSRDIAGNPHPLKRWLRWDGFRIRRHRARHFGRIAFIAIGLHLPKRLQKEETGKGINA